MAESAPFVSNIHRSSYETLLDRPASSISTYSCCPRHLKPNKLKVYVYHGPKRNPIGFLADFDVVITSFYTVSSIWRKCKDRQDDSNSIFSILWHRIVLDEGRLNYPRVLPFA